MTEGKPYSQKSGKGSSNYGDQVQVVTENTGERYPLSVQLFTNARNTIHPTQKPVALFEYLIRTYTIPGDVVMDNCLGSGTTAVAAENTGRRWIGIERDEGYFIKAWTRVMGL